MKSCGAVTAHDRSTRVTFDKLVRMKLAQRFVRYGTLTHEITNAGRELAT